LDTQIAMLEGEGARRGWEITGRYRDTRSGSMPAKDRPAFRQLWGAIGRGEVDAVAVVRLDRVARNTEDMLALSRELKAHGVALMSLNEPMLSTEGPQGELILTILAAVSTFERGLLRQRINEGLARARARGVKLGRRASLDASTLERARALKAQGRSTRAIGKAVGVSAATVSRALR
jgi:putative DNA-invertase from lambdoid prophage Rac